MRLFTSKSRKQNTLDLERTNPESRWAKNKLDLCNSLARFILTFFDIAKVQLPPAKNDLQQKGHTLLHKQIHCQYCMFDFTILIQSGPNGLERMLHIFLDDEKTEDWPPPVQIPWIRMAKVLTGLQRVHEDLQQSRFI